MRRWLFSLLLLVPVLRAAADGTIDVTKFGAVGDGVTLNTAPLQQAIDTCSAAGGGTLHFPAGRYLTGTIQLKDGVTLHLAAEAVILGSTAAADYRNLDPFTDGTGQQMGYALIVTVGARDVGLTGPGTIDGQGAALKATQERYLVRPFLVRWVRCTNVAVREVRLINSGAWTMHFFQSQNIAIERVTIRSKGLANNDGIDIDSSARVVLKDCDIDTGDDAICLKATSALPSRDITITGCQLASQCAAIKFGTESLGDFDKIRISHCQIRDTRLGGIKLLSVDGAQLHDVVISDLAMERVTVPVMLRLGARLKTFRPGDTAKPPGSVRDITIRNVRATAARQIGILISGVPGHPLENITLENIDLELAGGGTAPEAEAILPEAPAAYPEIRMFGPTMPAYGIYARHVRGITCKNVRTRVAAPDARPEKIFLDVEDLVASDRPATWGAWPAWGDQGDGTYLNPVLPTDYSDLDCIQVGPDYYAISSTFQYSPGVVILHSKDLVNWRILGHVVGDLNRISPELNWDHMNRYGRGVWAGAIRHHAGRFWVYFGTPDEGYFMSTATDPAGPWTPLHAVMKAPGWDDCCPFWDDDGQGWLVGTNFKDSYKTWLYKLTPDGRDLVPESRVLLNEGARREANKLYKINGTYYHFFSEWQEGVGRYVMMQRAKSITGPYTEVRQLSAAQREAMEPNQGGLVQTERGDWYFFTHHGTGQWEGRAASLLPVTWVDGWPIIGQVGADGLGTFVWSGKKPVAGTPVVTPQGSDEFNGALLAPQWEWNYQPRAEKWSLAEHPGFLRLHAFPPLRTADLRTAGNTLTQRALRTKHNVVTVSLDLTGMADGQQAGLAHFSRTHATLGVRQEGTTRTLVSVANGAATAGPVLTGHDLWLRSVWSLDGLSRFSYSLDGETFTDFGPPYQLAWGHYRGDRLGLFSFNDKAEAGHVDVDWFRYDYSGQSSGFPPSPDSPRSPP